MLIDGENPRAARTIHLQHCTQAQERHLNTSNRVETAEK